MSNVRESAARAWPQASESVDRTVSRYREAAPKPLARPVQPVRPAGNSLGAIYDVLKGVYEGRRRASNLSGRFDFKDRHKGSACLVMMLAGYKHELWPFVFPRFERAVPRDADVCVMSAGKYDFELDKLCELHGWSYLATRINDVSLIQNIAINLHREAETIVKVDEDIFLTAETLVDTLDYHQSTKARGIVDPCATSPMLNVNGVCYRPLLRRLGLLEKYEARFGVARCATLGVKATDDVEAAVWIWKHTAPLEETLARLQRAEQSELMAPVQFSIGAIVFDRAFWAEIGYLPVRQHQLLLRRSTLGADEEYLCRMAMFYARPVVICPHALAGHFSFGKQYEGMLEILDEKPEYFR